MIMQPKLLKDIFGKTKPIIGMVHFGALPGSPLYDNVAGVDGILKALEHDLFALQDCGIDAVMFGNENDRPYELEVSPATISTMSYCIGRLAPFIRVPFGVDVLWDPIATIAVAKATGAQFAREIFTGIFGGDLGFWNTNCGKALRFKNAIQAQKLILLFNINAEFACSLSNRSIDDVARSVVLSSLPDIVCVSGGITGEEVKISTLQMVKSAIPDTPVFANTGVNLDNVSDILAVADGVVVGTSLKRDGITWNEVDQTRVTKFMEKVNSIRGKEPITT